MLREKFYNSIHKLILPLFTGSYLVGEEPSTTRDSEVAYGKQNTLLVKANKTDDYRLVIKRGRAFQPFEANLLRIILRELNDISELQIEDSNYEQMLEYKAIEKAICESISVQTSQTMLGLITELENWSNRTYEGKKPTFGIIIDENDGEEEKASKLHFSDILHKDFVALLSDGKSSFIEFDKYGYFKGYISLAKVRTYVTTAPSEFDYVARYCNDKRIGLALTESGDLLVFRNRELMFAKRKGAWNVYSHEEVIQLLSYRSSHSLKDIRRAIYCTALDCSFEYNGGILIYLNKDMATKALMTINAKDILLEEYYNKKRDYELDEAGKLYNLTTASETRHKYSFSYEEFLQKNNCVKTNCLRRIIAGRKFQELGRKLREEMVGMDGATIIDFDGSIIAVGAILKIEAGSNEGGRLAAATNLAKYGISIKISQDGQMQGFCPEKKAPNGVRALFMVK